MKFIKRLKLWWIHQEHWKPRYYSDWCPYCFDLIVKDNLREKEHKRLAREVKESL